MIENLQTIFLCMANKILYESFGKLFAEFRINAGFSQQADLALKMNTKPQTVSRWELGQSRPRYKQMGALVDLLGLKKHDAEILFSAAHYDTKTPVASFDQPFPIDALSPDSFERFCHYFLEKLYQKLYSGAEVHRAGGSGHTQDGIDIDATLMDNKIHTFQCKRVEEFGPAKVKAAIKAHKRKADKMFILMSRVASPQARQEAKKHTRWEIWDKEDISLRIRNDLTKEEQIRLVDIFFNGQRMSLLGETEAGPWQTSEEFFAPFIKGTGVFSHIWELVGRTEEIRSITAGLTEDKTKAVFLIGAGGGGKSRTLREAVKQYETNNKSVVVRFLSPTEEVTNKSLEDLGQNKKILIVDDAHDRNDLRLLFQYAAIPDNHTTLLLSFRPYGLDYIKSQAGIFTLSGDAIAPITLERMTLEQATTLATQVLEKFNGPLHMAKEIATITRDCPLAVVIGAQVVAKEKEHFELAQNADEFRDTLFGKFQDIIAGEIGSKSNADSIKKVLRVLALLQPFHSDDNAVSRVGETVEKLSEPEIKRIIRLLIEGGVLFKRGGKYRLSPDMLADYIIEGACIGPEGSSTGYAESVFDVAGPEYVEHVLLNLGKLDWRLQDGDTTNSRLLDGVWKQLRPAQQYSDPHIKAVTAVAYYQPSRALDFAERQICEGEFLRDLPELIKYASYNFNFLKRGCECLWELGKKDSRQLGQHPGHAIRILSELCQVEPNKPVEYNAAVVDFAIGLLPRPDAWDYDYTPLDILKGIMRTEGHTNHSNGRAISFNPYFVNYAAVAKVREKAIDAVINLLSSPNIKSAILAAQMLQESIRYPMGQFGAEATLEARDEWTKAFCHTLEKVEATVKSGKLDPLVVIEIIRSVSWHAYHAGEETSTVAKRIIALKPDTLEFRVLSTLVDGYGQLLEHADFTKREKIWNEHLKTLTADLNREYPDAEKLYTFMSALISHIKKNKSDSDSLIVLVQRLIQASLDFARAIVNAALVNMESCTTSFAGIALAELLYKSHAEGLEKAKSFLASGNREMLARLGQAYTLFSEYTPDDIVIQKALLAHDDSWVVANALRGIRNVANANPTLAISLLQEANIGTSKQLADDVFVLFVHSGIPFELLAEDDIDVFLKKLMVLPEIDGYWTDAFLSKLSERHAPKAAKFFRDRVEHSVAIEQWRYRPCNYGPYGHFPLRFRSSPDFSLILREMVVWMKTQKPEWNDRQKRMFRDSAAQLFHTMFHPVDSELVGAVQNWVEVATAEDMPLISQIFNEVDPDFVFQHKDFVVRFMDKAKQYGKDIIALAEFNFYASATGGVRTGTPGEPFDRDIKMKENADTVLKDLPRFSSAYNLYNLIKQHAEQSIQRSLMDREMFEE